MQLTLKGMKGKKKGDLFFFFLFLLFIFHVFLSSMASLMFINTLRYSVLILSLIAFVFHFMQCFLFSKYQERV
jgi:hypothetical protein